LEAEEDFTELADELSLDDFTQDEDGDLGWHPQDVFNELLGTSVASKYAFSTEIGTLSQPIYDEKSKPIGYWLVNILERQEDNQAYVEVILVGSVEEADIVLRKLIEGEDFGELAREFSQDDSREQGGDLGWVSPGTKSGAFDAYVFDPEIEDVGIVGHFPDNTVITTGGYWLVQVLAVEDDRELATEDRDFLKNKALSAWIDALWDDPENEVESFLDADKKNWAIAQIN